MTKWLTTANLAWLLVYLLTMSGVVGGLLAARKQALADFASPDAQAQWDAFRDDMRKIAGDPHSPVTRQVPKSDEPPTLRLLRDYFGTVLLLSLLLTSALFITFMVMVRGVMSSNFVPREDSPGQQP
jgi:hypothetical protein